MSRRSIHADDDEDLQHPLLPTDRGGVDSSTPLLRQGTLPHAANTTANVPSSSHLMAPAKSPIHLDFDSNDDDSSSVDSFYSSGGAKSSGGGGRLRHLDPNMRVGLNAPPGNNIQVRPASMEDLDGHGSSVYGGASSLPPLMLREQPPSHAPTPLPALMSQDAGGKRGIANLRPKRIKRISNYVLGPLMGEGTLGHVRDALDCSKQLVERVAVKTIRRKHRSEAELRRVAAILENEVEHLQRYHHPNIIRAVDIFHRDGKDYIVLPIATCSLEQLVQFRRREINKRRYTLFSDRASSISGISLLGGGGGGASSTRFSNQHLGAPTSPSGALSQFHFSPRALFPVQLVKDIFFQFLSGLAYMHKQGVSHNDLKPANILLFGDGVVKLADLGTCATTFKGRGTPAFVSPQVASASCDTIDGRKNDMWACGVILFYLLTNMMPFHRESEYALYETIARGEVNFDLVPSEETLEAAQSSLPSPSNNNNNNNSIRSTSSSGSKDNKAATVGGSAGSFAAAGGSFGGAGATANTAKHLLRQLLEKSQDKRISAADALQHQWLSSCGANNTITEVPAGGANNKRRTTQTAEQSPSPSTQEKSAGGQLAGDRAGYLKKVVCNVRELAAVMERDAVSHLQFVCEAASTAGIAVPSLVFRPSDAESDSDDDPGRALLASNITEPTRVSGVAGTTAPGNGNARQRNDTVATTTAKRIAPPASGHSKHANAKDDDALPRGTVFRNRFLGVEELAHYGRKGHPECDVRSLRLDAQKRSLLHDYMQHTIAARGYYGRRKQMEALGMPIDDIDDATSKQRCCCVIC